MKCPPGFWHWGKPKVLSHQRSVTYLALVATAQAAAVADNVQCNSTGTTCSVATSFCCLAYTTTGLTTVSADGFCKPALTADITTAATDLK